MEGVFLGGRRARHFTGGNVNARHMLRKDHLEVLYDSTMLEVPGSPFTVWDACVYFSSPKKKKNPLLDFGLVSPHPEL